jgi:protein TonB
MAATRKQWAIWIVAGLLALALIGALVSVIYGLLTDKGKRKPPQQQVFLLKPPPPPPPPKDEPKPPPPEVKKEEVKIPENKPDEAKPADQPEGKALGVDATGGPGNDGFGLVGNKGGRDLLAGAGGSRNAYFGGLVQQHVQQVLSRNKKLRGEEFRVAVSVWLRPDGTVQRAELVGSSGKPDTDELIRAALTELRGVREGPPNDMPQPVRLMVTNKF